MSASCVRCAAPRVPGPECPHCGVIYARAERRQAEHSPVTPEEHESNEPEAEAGAPEWPPPPRGPSAAALWAQREAQGDMRTELKLAQFAVPAALVVAFVLVQVDLGRFFVRTFLSMWLHELGHASTAWLCGFAAVPGPWFTSVGEERSLLFALTVTAVLGWLGWRAWTSEDRAGLTIVAGLLLVQIVATLLLSTRTAQMLITFGGDAGALVLGVVCIATFYVPPEHKLHRDWLRWGLLVIGAGTFADVFDEWWKARSDHDLIPFGEFEHGGPTDPSVLVDTYGWTIPSMISRFLAVGVLSILVLIPLQWLHVRRTRERLEQTERG